MPKRETHLHKYERIRLGKGDYVVFRCTLPGCRHYIRKELAKNRVCMCNRCEEPMILDTAAMLLQKPHCSNCVQRKNKDVMDTLNEAFS